MHNFNLTTIKRARNVIIGAIKRLIARESSLKRVKLWQLDQVSGSSNYLHCVSSCANAGVLSFLSDSRQNTHDAIADDAVIEFRIKSMRHAQDDLDSHLYIVAEVDFT